MPDSLTVVGATIRRRIAPGFTAAGALVLFGVAAAAVSGGLSAHLAHNQVWWLTMAAAALGLVAASVATPWRTSGLVAAVALAGASAQLALTNPVWFPYVDLRPKTAFDLVFWAMIALQGLVVVAALSVHRGLPHMLKVVPALGVWRSIVFALLIGSALLGAQRFLGNREYIGLAKQLAIAAVFLLVNFGSVIALARTLPPAPLAAVAARVAELVSLPGATPALRPLDRRLPILLAAWVFGICALWAFFIYQRIPHIADEIAYLFQARYFAQGLIDVPAPPPPAAEGLRFDFLNMVGGRWFSTYPPGWPAVLALGVRLGVPWLVNPLLGAAAIWMAHAVASRLASRGVANVAALLMATSPWFLGMSAGMMSHPLTLALVLGAWLLLLKARESHGVVVFPAFGAGAALGLVFLTRPVDGLIMGVLTGLWTLSFLTDRRQWRAVVAFGLGCLIVGVLIFPYNQHLIGNALETPVNAYFDKMWGLGANRMGFGPDIGADDAGYRFLDPWPGHTPLQALVWIQLNLAALNTDLFGWGGGSLALVLALLIWGRWTRLDLAMAAIIAVVIGVFSFYWFNDAFTFGARYWHMALVPLVLLSVSGACTLWTRMTALGGPEAGRRLGAVLVALAVFGVGSFTTWRAATRYFEFRGVHVDFRAFAQSPNLARALIIVDDLGDNEQYDSAFLFNQPTLPKDRPIFARDLGEASNRAAAAAFPDRPVYFMRGRTMDGAPAGLTRGPVRPTPKGWVPMTAGPAPEAAGRTRP